MSVVSLTDAMSVKRCSPRAAGVSAPVCSAIRTIFAASVRLPPPTVTTTSAPASRAARAAWSTASRGVCAGIPSHTATQVPPRAEAISSTAFEELRRERLTSKIARLQPSLLSTSGRTSAAGLPQSTCEGKACVFTTPFVADGRAMVAKFRRRAPPLRLPTTSTADAAPASNAAPPTPRDVRTSTDKKQRGRPSSKPADDRTGVAMCAPA
mmetsp:Transcript_13835/g.48850  ORF Transcript_13835/g.48850 Transcript_13835/m.48850 type:complete len:210 (+) Transcript_13835:857-1486(+)